jgi:uncharacterized protein (DUF1697 family)
MKRYVALLRGINVGGNNLIKMTALKACFEKQGLLEVVTYIQSGNVVFGSDDGAADTLGGRIERALAAAFRYDANVVLRTHKEMQQTVGRAPKGFGTQPDKYRYDVIFLKAPLTAPVAIKSVATAPGVDEAHAGPGVLYFSRLISEASRSRLSKIVSSPIYKSVTIRNWNTTTKLLRMMDAP